MDLTNHRAMPVSSKLLVVPPLSVGFWTRFWTKRNTLTFQVGGSATVTTSSLRSN